MPFRVANNPAKNELVLTVVRAIGFHWVWTFVLFWHSQTDCRHADLREDRWVLCKPLEMGTSLVDLSVAKRILITQSKTELTEPTVIST